MAQSESDPFWKFLTGLVVGVSMTWCYVRFGFQLPGIVELPAKVTSAAISVTADADLENWNLPLHSRQRAAAVILGQNPDQLIALDESLEHAILSEMLRLKAVRRAKIAKATFSAYDTALQQPAIREQYERHYGTTDAGVIKQKWLQRDISDDEFLHGYLAANWPQESIESWCRRVLEVYQTELRPETPEIATSPSETAIR